MIPRRGALPVLLLLASCGASGEEQLWSTTAISSSAMFEAHVIGSADGTPRIGILCRRPPGSPAAFAWKDRWDGGQREWVINGNPAPRRAGFTLWVNDPQGRPRELMLSDLEAFPLRSDRISLMEAKAFERFWNEVVAPRFKP